MVSIVTPTLNAGRFLLPTIESVLRQDYPRIEYIVADSGSSDGSKEIVKAFAGRVRLLHVPRRGPAFAIHEGFRHASGEILGWLNGDDTYEPGCIRSAVRRFIDRPDAGVVYGEARWIDERGRTLGRYPTIPFRRAALERTCFISQPAAFFRASAYARCPLDPSLPVSFDYDLWLRMVSFGIRFEHLPHFLANSRMHAGALTFRRRLEVLELGIALLKKNCSYAPLPWIYGLVAYTRDGRDQFFEKLLYSPMTYAASLPFGLSINREQPGRFLLEWLSTPVRGLARACRDRSRGAECVDVAAGHDTRGSSQSKPTVARR